MNQVIFNTQQVKTKCSKIKLIKLSICYNSKLRKSKNDQNFKMKKFLDTVYNRIFTFQL